jgi:hypothetical protein
MCYSKQKAREERCMIGQNRSEKLSPLLSLVSSQTTSVVGETQMTAIKRNSNYDMADVEAISKPSLAVACIFTSDKRRW